jgi:hypothetical protein
MQLVTAWTFHTMAPPSGESKKLVSMLNPTRSAAAVSGPRVCWQSRRSHQSMTQKNDTERSNSSRRRDATAKLRAGLTAGPGFARQHLGSLRGAAQLRGPQPLSVACTGSHGGEYEYDGRLESNALHSRRYTVVSEQSEE